MTLLCIMLLIVVRQVDVTTAPGDAFRETSIVLLGEDHKESLVLTHTREPFENFAKRSNISTQPSEGSELPTFVNFYDLTWNKLGGGKSLWSHLQCEFESQVQRLSGDRFRLLRAYVADARYLVVAYKTHAVFVEVVSMTDRQRVPLPTEAMSLLRPSDSAPPVIAWVEISGSVEGETLTVRAFNDDGPDGDPELRGLEAVRVHLKKRNRAYVWEEPVIAPWVTRLRSQNPKAHQEQKR